MEQAGDNIGRHNLGLGIVLLHDIVVELACVGDLLFQRFQLILQSMKFVLACSCG